MIIIIFYEDSPDNRLSFEDQIRVSEILSDTVGRENVIDIHVGRGNVIDIHWPDVAIENRVFWVVKIKTKKLKVHCEMLLSLFNPNYNYYVKINKGWIQRRGNKYYARQQDFIAPIRVAIKKLESKNPPKNQRV